MAKLPKSAICEECQSRHQGICGALTAEQLEQLALQAQRRDVHAGATLLDPAKEVLRFSVILQGAVKLTKLMPDGRQQIVGLQYAPDFLGRPYANDVDVSVESVTEAKVCSFPRHLVERLIEDNPELEHRLYLQALAELDEARDLLLTLGQKTARERVSTFLLLIARQAQRHGGAGELQSINLLLTRAEIADFLGLTIETVSRQLHKLQDFGIVKLAPKKGIRIIDFRRLQAEAGGDDVPLADMAPLVVEASKQTSHET